MKFVYHGKTIAYKKVGEGTPVVLLHGFGEESTIWDEQMGTLKNACMLIVPDLPGSGKSDLLDGAATIEDWADAIYALLAQELISHCILLGHSMGGYITLAFAQKFPNALFGFGLIHSTAFADNTEKQANRIKGIQMIDEYGGYSFLKNTLPNLFSATFRKEQPGKVEQLIEQAKQFGNKALIQYYTAMKDRPDLTQVLKQSKVPVLFIVGTEDTAAPMKDLLQQVHLPAVAQIHLLEGVAHMGMWENTEAVNNHLLHFIELVATLE